MNYFLPGAREYSKPEQIVNFHTQLLEKLRNFPGIKAAGITNVAPGDGYYGEREFLDYRASPAARWENIILAAYRTADPEYFFPVLQIPLIRGRLFSGDQRLDHDK